MAANLISNPLVEASNRTRRHSIRSFNNGPAPADGKTYLIAGAAAVALLGTAFPILFSRKDLCPECDGAGFIRQSGVALRGRMRRGRISLRLSAPAAMDLASFARLIK